MTYYYITSNTLAHHGIKGQRWGVRRYQNEDGTLTEAGKKRYIMTRGEKDKKIAKYKVMAGIGKGLQTAGGAVGGINLGQYLSNRGKLNDSLQAIKDNARSSTSAARGKYESAYEQFEKAEKNLNTSQRAYDYAKSSYDDYVNNTSGSLADKTSTFKELSNKLQNANRDLGNAQLEYTKAQGNANEQRLIYEGVRTSNNNRVAGAESYVSNYAKARITGLLVGTAVSAGGSLMQSYANYRIKDLQKNWVDSGDITQKERRLADQAKNAKSDGEITEAMQKAYKKVYGSKK